MHSIAKRLGIDRLSVAERIRLVEEIWDRIAAEPDAPEIPEAHKAELDRRLAAYEADPDAGSTWEEVKGPVAGSVSTKRIVPTSRLTGRIKG